MMGVMIHSLRQSHPLSILTLCHPLIAYSPSHPFLPLSLLQLGKTVVAGRNLKAGETLQEEDVVAKVAEPRGLPATRIDELVGGCLNRDVQADESILAEDVL